MAPLILWFHRVAWCQNTDLTIDLEVTVDRLVLRSHFTTLAPSPSLSVFMSLPAIEMRIYRVTLVDCIKHQMATFAYTTPSPIIVMALLLCLVWIKKRPERILCLESHNGDPWT